MITENLSTLKIHKLTQEQYDRELQAGRVDPSALYLTPDEVNGSGGTSVFVQDDEPTDVDTGTLWLDTDEEGTGGGGAAADIPTFNLTEMGLPGVPLDGTEVSIEVDTTAFMEALANGQVKITVLLSVNGGTYSVTDIVSAVYIFWNQGYVLSKMVPFDALYLYEVAVYEGSIFARVHTLQTALPDADLPKAETGVF